jgi:hypothetical protein
VTRTAHVPALAELEVLRAAIQRAIPWLAAQSNPEAAAAARLAAQRGSLSVENSANRAAQRNELPNGYARVPPAGNVA